MSSATGTHLAIGVLVVVIIIAIAAVACRQSYRPLQMTQKAGSSPAVQAVLWPHPNKIHQGHQTLRVAVPKLSSMPAFQKYRAELDRQCSSPLSDFDNYVQGLGLAHAGTKLKFNVSMSTLSYPLANRTLKTFTEDESYHLHIDTHGQVTISAPTYIGVGYAITTLQQLLQPDEHGSCTISHLPVHIQDAPRTYHRNVMIDTARNFFSTGAICRVLQQMGAHKMNHFDWHISDNQSFPLNVGPITKIFSVTPSSDPTFANMIGAFDPEKSYSASDVKRIIGRPWGALKITRGPCGLSKITLAGPGGY